MPFLEGFSLADWDGPAVFIFFAMLVITDKLVWHTRLKKAEANAAKWEGIALEALGVAGKVTTAAEVLTEPDPAKESTS